MQDTETLPMFADEPEPEREYWASPDPCAICNWRTKIGYTSRGTPACAMHLSVAEEYGKDGSPARITVSADSPRYQRVLRRNYRKRGLGDDGKPLVWGRP